jgi:prevent-host-death family protein
MEVGNGELRANLNRFVKRVREGEEVVITDHGKAVAQLLPVGERKLDRWIREGLVIPAPNRGRRT